MTQDGTATPACTYSLSRSSTSIPASGGTGSFELTAPSVCSWRTELSDGWLRLLTPARGSGTATFTFTADRHQAFAPRTGEIVVAGDASDGRLVHNVMQAGVPSVSR